MSLKIFPKMKNQTRARLQILSEFLLSYYTSSFHIIQILFKLIQWWLRTAFFFTVGKTVLTIPFQTYHFYLQTYASVHQLSVGSWPSVRIGKYCHKKSESAGSKKIRWIPFRGLGLTWNLSGVIKLCFPTSSAKNS